MLTLFKFLQMLLKSVTRVDKNTLSHHELYILSILVEQKGQTINHKSAWNFAFRGKNRTDTCNNVINAFIIALHTPFSTEIVTPGKSPTAGIQ